MAQYTIEQYKALYGTSGTEFPDNTSAEITPEVMRQFGEDTADSIIPSTTGIVSTVSRTLTRSEILALNTTPITILAAPGTGYFYIVRDIWGYYDTQGDTYAAGGGVMRFQYTNLPFTIGDFVTTFIEQTSDRIAYIAVSSGTSAPDTNFVNSAVRVTHTVGNPTATGPDTGTIKVFVTYTLIQL